MAPARRIPQPGPANLTSFHPLHALAFLAGVLTLYVQPSLPSPWLCVGLIFIALMLCYCYRGVGLLALCGALGFAWTAWLGSQQLADRWPEARHGDDLWLTGHIRDIPERRNGQWRFVFQSPDHEGLIRTAWYRHDAALLAGQCWKLSLRMRTPRGSMNPAGLDYEGWLFRNGFTATAYVRQAAQCDIPAEGVARINQWRHRARDGLEAALAGHPMTHVITALVLGERSGFTQDDWRVLRRTGTSHLMAISGLHVGIVALWTYALGLFAWRCVPMLQLRMPALRMGILCSVCTVLIYCVISGLGLPAQRAMIMLFCFYYALWRGRMANGAQLLSLALVAILVIHPFSVASAGFWLSFVAVAWIFYLLGGRWQSGGRLWHLIWLQVGLGLVLAPLCLFWFSEAAWVSPLVNALLVPLFTVIVPVLLVLSVALFLGLPGAEALLQITAEGLHWLWQALVWVEHQLGAGIGPTQADLWVMGLAVVGLFWMLAPRGWPARLLGLLLVMPMVMAILMPSRYGGTRLTLLDVGQGLAVVLETGTRVLVYDAGPAYPGGFDAGEMVVVPYLQSRGVKTIDMLMQSHGDLDHRGGMDAVREHFAVRTHYGLAQDRPCQAGTTWQWGQVVFRILHPAPAGWQGNDGSCVVRIEIGETAILLTGDIERRGEFALMHHPQALLKADILLAPHHGSNSSSGMRFLRAVQPSLTLVSAGWKNRWGFPRDEVLARYGAIHSEVLNTAESGAIQIEFDASGQMRQVIRWRKQAARFWHAPG